MSHSNEKDGYNRENHPNWTLFLSMIKVKITAMCHLEDICTNANSACSYVTGHAFFASTAFVILLEIHTFHIVIWTAVQTRHYGIFSRPASIIIRIIIIVQWKKIGAMKRYHEIEYKIIWKIYFTRTRKIYVSKGSTDMFDCSNCNFITNAKALIDLNSATHFFLSPSLSFHLSFPLSNFYKAYTFCQNIERENVTDVGIRNSVHVSNNLA